MQLETERLILRSFGEEDVDIMAQLFTNTDFMRFSLGVFTERKQTVAFIEKVIGWDRVGIPSQFAVVPRGEKAVIGYCGFFITLKCQMKSRSGTGWIPITGTAASSPKPCAQCAITAFADSKLPRVISLVHPENIPSRRVAEKNGMKMEKRITFRGFPTLVYAMTREAWLANRDAS